MDRPFTVGTLLSRTFSVWGRNLPAIGLVSLLTFSPLLAIIAFTRAAESPAFEPTQNLISTILSFVLTGAVTSLVLQHLHGEPIRIGRVLAAAAERFFAIFSASFWSGLAAGIGLLLLVVPGLVFIAMYFVAVPVAVVERPGAFASLERSAALTKGYRWQVFGAAALLWLAAMGAVVAVGLLAGPGEGRPGALLAEVVMGALAGSLTSVASAVAYHDLRVAKEGVDSADLVRVFE